MGISLQPDPVPIRFLLVDQLQDQEGHHKDPDPEPDIPDSLELAPGKNSHWTFPCIIIYDISRGFGRIVTHNEIV